MNKTLLLTITLLGCLNVEASTLLLTPGDTLRVDFATDPITTPCPVSCDLLTLFLVVDAPNPPGVQATASLYSGATLVGVSTNYPYAGLSFISPTNGYGAGTVVDLSIFQAPFSGTFYVTATDVMAIDADLTNVNLGYSTSPGSSQHYSATARISSIALVPEPRYTAILAISLLLMAVGKTRYSSPPRGTTKG